MTIDGDCLGDVYGGLADSNDAWLSRTEAVDLAAL
jgi:hypothetical protein